MFIGLLSFIRSLATRCVSLINEPCTDRSTLIDLNPVELKYYPFMVSLDKCSGSCNSFDDLSTRIFAPSKTKDVNLKVFNMITNRNGAKTLVNIFHVIVNGNFNSATCSSNQTCKNVYNWNPSTCICENSKHLKHIVDDSKFVCDDITYVMDIVSTNVRSTVSINSDGKK